MKRLISLDVAVAALALFLIGYTIISIAIEAFA